ncbi:hypothetical protein Aperf_G00000064652 [Anoplocephala perfoliata]
MGEIEDTTDSEAPWISLSTDLDYEQFDIPTSTSPKERVIFVNRQSSYKFCNNSISTGKYSVATFIPKFLFEQFRKYANIFFLLVALFQQIPGVSPTGRFTTVVPLTFILCVSAVKEIIEDYARHSADKATNNSKTYVLRNGAWKMILWKDVQVGDIVKLTSNSAIPADLVIIATSEPLSMCYIETSNLDGETSLKMRQGLSATSALLSADVLRKTRLRIECEQPTRTLDAFVGTLYDENNVGYPLDSTQMLLRGATLKNTNWVFGAVVYTGKESKVMLNSTAAPLKRSSVDKQTNYYTGALSLEVVILILRYTSIGFKSLPSDTSAVWFANFPDDIHGRRKRSMDKSRRGTVNLEERHVYVHHGLHYLPHHYSNQPPSHSGSRTLCSSSVHQLGESSGPVVVDSESLLLPEHGVVLYAEITILVKTPQESVTVYNQRPKSVSDLDMYDAKTDTPAMARTSNLNEDLGQVKYIFSDKTGTLTKNVMEFKMCSIGRDAYGLEDQEGSALQDYRLLTKMDQGDRDVDWFFTILAVCHTVIPEYVNVDIDRNDVRYQATSPDELALVTAAKAMGYVFCEREPDLLTIRVKGEKFQFKLLHVIEFTSERKRMSVIVEDADGKLFLMVKGADTVIYDRLVDDARFRKETLDHMDVFAKIGLRTLCIAFRRLDRDYYEKWDKVYYERSIAVTNRAALVDESYEEIEQELELVGSTAIEDKLQDDVPQTIANMLAAGISMWVLTGDKKETAVNIG